MATPLGDHLPDDLLERLSGARLEEVSDKVILVFTTDRDGWPHPAMLSYFEVVALDRANVRMALYNDSTTTGNMLRNGAATIVIVDERVAYYVKGQVDELAHSMRCMSHNAKLNLRVRQVLADAANEEFEPGAYVAGGITYVNPNRARELERARSLIAELRE
jgi:hypothetical protein